MKFIHAIVLLLLTGMPAYADHVLGGELLYTHVAGDNYKITLTLYGDCGGGTFSHLLNAEPRVTITNELNAFSTVILYEETDKRKEVSNVCPAEEANTKCKNPAGTVPGVTRFVYSTVTQLTPASNWRLAFTAQMDHTGKLQTGFSNAISNMTNNTGFGFYLMLESMLNNLHSHNSSPQYTTIPTPYYCINSAQQYNPGASDADGDELAFKLTRPFDVNGIVTTYVSPYTPATPFSTAAGSFNYNQASGQMSFIPNKQEVALIVHKTEEYRNGALVGSSMRAMTFFMLGNCNNEAPYGHIAPSSVSGGILDGNTINVCLPAHTVFFKIPVTDKNHDDINVALSNIPPGASASVQANNTKSPVIDFKWELTNATGKAYTFFAGYNDGACPMPGKQDMAYTINVVFPISVFHEVLAPTNCKYKQAIQFHLDGGLLPRKVVVTNNTNDTIATYIDNEGSIKDSFAVGQYKITAYAEKLGCNTSYNFEVTDFGVYPDPPRIDDKNLCIDAPVEPLTAVPAPGGTVRWYDLQRNLLPAVPTYTTSAEGRYQWLINQEVNVCESVYDTIEVNIHPHPNVEIVNAGGHVCIGERITLIATGAERYEWQPAEKITPRDGQPSTTIYQPETFTVTGFSKYGCTGLDTLVFDDIELCCRFMYPDAFTPNSDGINDGWHPITYGNVEFYQVSVFNRWGERVYTSSDPRQRWDGMYKGIKCDMGTYYYRLKATCVTGQQEETGGSFILIR